MTESNPTSNESLSYVLSINSAPDIEEISIANKPQSVDISKEKIQFLHISPSLFNINYHNQLKELNDSYKYDINNLNNKIKDSNEPKLNNNQDQLENTSAKKRKTKSKVNINGEYIGPWKFNPLDNTEDIVNELQIDLGKTENNKMELKLSSISSTPNNTNNEEQKADISYVDIDTEINKKVSSSKFLGKSRFDYQGRTWLTCPSNLNKSRHPDSSCYIPKKLHSTLIGHTMGVQTIRFIPKTGHMLLSASLDSTIRIWDITKNNNKCMYLYSGHEKAVRDIQFISNSEGICTDFYSCSYDKQTLLWDIEYGKIKGRFTNKKVPYCIAVHPNDETSFIVGCSNKKAVQFDSRSGNIVQEYNEHMGAVNTVTFCENGKKLVTTSDDKKMFIWDYGIPIVVKHIADTSMQSMPYVTLHPTKQFMACQSMDNQIVVYEAHSRFRLNKKKFTGLNNSGYAIQCDISPDGQFLASGDIKGKIYFWDWNNTKNYRIIQAHDGICIGCQWHPILPSRVATCGWDGTIKLWD
ncbi:hypothetical protein cand_032460 [Cryptosporidium andersoni]|uniref:Pre-mRNA-processing factor 17 n=1 Tax=Cryptosporidium andersoni TaxID=117008 RepID=A0A1J4MFB3_9CRYT|nr:hypothetical protein cand_032460 [Cryptosporidium andersoni]